ncbi:response regulator transcription factor [Micromonospora sp. WMMD734]|uniref:response regulator transcription factor n=1 Tax=Micromonospora sp. WMMD734 TaxID=3404129 RepID=UPI003B94C7C0
MIRVLLVDDQHLIRAGLRMLCDAQPDIEVVGEADNGRDAVTLAARLVPDVVVMDLRMPGVDGITATGRILADRPATRVLVLTTFGDDDHLYPALTAGACGFLLKDAPPGELVDGVRRAAAGGSPFSEEVLQRLVRRAVHARAEPSRPAAGLTAREQDVLALVAEGLSNTEIADRLHIGVTTVKTHITSLMTKTDSPNRVRLALFARGG